MLGQQRFYLCREIASATWLPKRYTQYDDTCKWTRCAFLYSADLHTDYKYTVFLGVYKVSCSNYLIK